MPDNILQDTLTTPTPQLPQTPKSLTVPDLTGNNKADIGTLKSVQQQPSSLLNLQKAMSNSTRAAYNERQSSELAMAGQQFDPTKVSGGTFAGILQNLEANRGADISKVYATTMNTYAQVQEQITSRLQFLEQLEEQKKQW